MTEPKQAAAVAVAHRLPSGRPVRPVVVRAIQRQVSKYDEAIREMQGLEKDLDDIETLSSKSPEGESTKEE